MDNAQRQVYEEEHYDKVRQLNQANELLEDYQREINQKTGQLVDYLYSFYQDIPEGAPSNLSQPFEEVVNAYAYDLRLKHQEIEEMRAQEQRDFNFKMDE